MREGFRRTAFAVIAGYGTNAILVAISEAIYNRFVGRRAYFIVDLLTQVFATVIGGYVCCRLARTHKVTAAACQTVLGLLVGTTSLVSSWDDQPHWYGIALLLVYVPCVWAGYALVVRHEV